MLKVYNLQIHPSATGYYKRKPQRQLEHEGEHITYQALDIFKTGEFHQHSLRQTVVKWQQLVFVQWGLHNVLSSPCLLFS